MKPCFLLVGYVLLSILITGCDLDPVTWDGKNYSPLEAPTNANYDAGLDGGEIETDEE